MAFEFTDGQFTPISLLQQDTLTRLFERAAGMFDFYPTDTPETARLYAAGVNPEYLRGMVELIREFVGLNWEDDTREAIELGIFTAGVAELARSRAAHPAGKGLLHS